MALSLEFLNTAFTAVKNFGLGGFTGAGQTVAPTVNANIPPQVRKVTLEPVQDAVAGIISPASGVGFFAGDSIKKVTKTSDSTFVSRTIDTFKPALNASLGIVKKEIKNFTESQTQSLFDSLFKRKNPTTHKPNLISPSIVSGVQGVVSDVGNLDFINAFKSLLENPIQGLEGQPELSEIPTNVSPSGTTGFNIGSLIPLLLIGGTIAFVAKKK